MIRLYRFIFLLLVICVVPCGCGSTKSRSATEQLLVSDAVDRSIHNIDFRPLSGNTVYLDTQYVKSVKGTGFVNADYIVSSLREQLMAANCYIEEDRNKAEYIAEVRVGALGTDSHDVTYGIPASNALSSAASLVPNAPPIPMVPEISLAKRAVEVAAAKIAVFAYHRETREPVWRSGIAQSQSSAKDFWLLGAGPFQRGSLHRKTQFAGENIVPELDIPLIARDQESEDSEKPGGESFITRLPAVDEEGQSGAVEQASHESEGDDESPARKADSSGEGAEASAKADASAAASPDK